MPLTVGVRWNGKTHSLALGADASVAELQEAVAQQCGVERTRQQLRGGFPPKPLDLSVGTATLRELGLRDRDSLTLQEAEPVVQAAAGAAWRHAVLPAEAVGNVERLVIPADNSCLFNSILNALGLAEKLTPMSVREVVKAQILGDPALLDAECQADSGKDSLSYAEWITKPDSWGGFIDLHLLSRHFNAQICAVCIRTLHVHSFPEEPTGDARIFVLFDGIHYDCVIASGSKAGIFSVKDDFTMSKAVAVAMELKELKQFTDTANFTLQCQHCFKLLKGEADAQQHAKETGHFNFQEAPGKS